MSHCTNYLHAVPRQAFDAIDLIKGVEKVPVLAFL
jgi:hypothetical protein